MPIRIQLWLLIAIAVITLLATQNGLAQNPKTYNQLASAILKPEFHAPPADPAPKAKPLSEAKKKTIPKHGVINYDIYRDRNPYPVDPRKLCHVCVQRESNSKSKALHSRIPGFQGRPYQEKEPGGCLCGKKKQKFKHPNFNVYWPTFAAGVPEELFPVKSANKASNYQRFRLVDMFDNLGGWELCKYERKDNGHCGKGRERYGCLGESRFIESRVSGVGFRPPAQPVPRGGIAFP